MGGRGRRGTWREKCKVGEGGGHGWKEREMGGSGAWEGGT